MKSKIETAPQPFTPPVVSQSNPKDWYVFFQFFHDGKIHERKLRKGINRYPDLKERRKEADALRQATEDKLKLGWNPVIDPEFKARNVVASNNLKQMNFCESMDFALTKKKPDLSKKSIQDYRNVLEIVKTKAVALGLSFLPVREVTRLHVLELLTGLQNERNMSNHRFNIYLGVIRSMFTTLEAWTICEYNPASKITTKEVAESGFYSSYTQEEKVRISEHLCKKQYRLFVFMQFVYHTGIRPKELLALKISDIDEARRLITIYPDLGRENSKTNSIRPVPITNALFPFVREMNLKAFPADFFIFGSPFQPGQGNRGGGSVRHPWGQRRGFNRTTGVCGAMRPDFLTPSPYMASRDTVGRLWKTLVKDPETGLGINKCLYAAKHTGADDKILAGIDLDALRNLYGHRSKQMTQRYAKQINEIFNSNIRTQAPAFTSGKVRKIA